jgi:hypothetical protein
MVKENLDREIVKKSNHTSASFIVLTLSLGLLFMYTTTAVQWTQILTPAHAATTNSTEQAKSAANQTGEKMQAGAANVTQGTKSAANQTGEKMQAGAANVTQGIKSTANQTGEAGQSLMNKTGEFLNKTGEFFKGLISSNKTK